MRFPLLGRWEDCESGKALVERLCVAETFLQRLAGLQFARPLPPDCGLLLRGCRSVHTLWMRFSIDVAFLSEGLEVVELRLGASPWGVVIPRTKRVAHVVEMTAGLARGIFVGQQTRITPTLSAAGEAPIGGSPGGVG